MIAFIDKNELYTLYAEGKLISKFTAGDVSQIELDSNYAVTLYYKYPFNHRRLYVCISGESKKLKYCHCKNLPNISEKLLILSELRGRNYDYYKRAMDYLNQATMGEFYKLNPSFFFQLAYLCQKNLATKILLNKLVRKYDSKIILKDNIKW